METLLPSEVARLVLGYLEEEKCTEASKCFLDSSHHLSEYRILAQRGRKYPTKVNGCSLKEVLEEYCLVHSIVQESLSSMTEQPNGGSLIDNLRYVVRHCQPVQVHINLHPQGQTISATKSDNLDTSSGSTRPRTRKTTLSQGQAVENVDQTSISQPASNSTVKDSLAEGLITTSSTDTHITTQPHLLQPQHVTSAKTVCTQVNQEVNVNTKFSLSSQSEFEQCQNAGLSSQSDQIILPASSSTFQVVSVDRLQDQHPLISTTQQSDSSTLSRNSQQLPLSINNSNQGTEYLQLEGPETVKDFAKPEECNRSYVTKCFGSSIVFLDNDTQSESCVSENLPLNNTIQENYDSKKSNTKLTPTKTKVDKVQLTEKFKEKMLNSEVMVSKLVENINKVWTPAKLSDNSEAISESLLPNLDAAVVSEPYLDEFLQEFLLFDHDIPFSSDDESDVLNSSQSIKKKKSSAKENNKGVSKLKQLCENAVSNISVDGSTPSKQSLVKLISSASFTVPERATPAKGPDGIEVMTPMTKLLKSITSPSGELYLEPTQFANLLDFPASATKSQEQTSQTQQAPSQFSQPYSLPLNNVIEVPRPFGPPISIPVVNCSPTEVAEYSSQEGVSTLCAIEVLTNHGSFKPIVPKLKPGDVLPPAPFEGNQPKKRQQRTKRCTARGGRKTGIQSSQDVDKAVPETDNSGLVTIYGADGVECKTISYRSSSDLPILVSDTPDEAVDVETLEGDNNVKDLPKNSQDEPDIERHADVETGGSISEDKESSVPKEENNDLPPLNASLIRGTPGFNGPSRANEKRMSFSTPRRRLSHIRALDFNTPPKENDQSIRRANTSPKNMSTNALSPNTTGKSIKSSMMGSLFKAPGSGLRRTSKVKAHLFKSPEYPMTLSSGYKVPHATSTPYEASCSKDFNALPPPSGAWDQIGGVSLILNSGTSPVKRVEPQCKKELRSWDADLRSLISSEPQPLPKEPVQPTPKRKVAPAAQRKRGRGKKNQKAEESKAKEEESLDKTKTDENVDVCTEEKQSFEKSHEMSTASDSEMAKMLECNLMDVSSEGVNKGNSSKRSSAISPGNEKEIEVDKGKNVLEESGVAVQKSPGVKPVLTKAAAEGNCLEDSSKAVSQMDHSDNSCVENNDLVSNDVVQEPTSKNARASKESIDKKEHSEKKVCTPVSDALVGSAVNKFGLSQATFKESFSFETPMKDNAFANMVPQTPCFLDPSLQSNEDTPRTKIIKAIPLIPSAEIGVSNTPTVPPTPTIRTTPTVSPNCPSYFKPKESPSRRTQMFKNSPKIKSFDNLSSILVQECSRLEASGMRESNKKSVMECSEKSELPPTAKSKDDSGSSKKISGDCENKDVIIINGPSPRKAEDKRGCARLMDYKRKPVTKLIKDAVSASKLKPSFADEMEDCWIVSPQKSSAEGSVKADTSLESVEETYPRSTKSVYGDEVPTSRRRSSNSSKSSQPAEECTCDGEVSTSPLSTPSSQTIEADILKAQEVLGMKILGDRLSVISSEEKSSVGLAVSIVSNLIKNESSSPLRKSHSTPVKVKSAEKTRASSSKKKTPLRKNQDSVMTDDEDSSDSSSSGSSSDSDSNSSSSSSSDEGTPVKQNASPVKQPTPVKSKLEMSPEKCQLNSEATPLLDAHEQVSSKSSQAEMATTERNAYVPQVMDSAEQAPDEVVAADPEQVPDKVVATSPEPEPKEAVAAASVNKELKSLAETKDMGTCERNASIRNAHSTKMPNIMIEMEEKRSRMLAFMKGKPSGRSVARNSKDKVLMNPFATQVKSATLRQRNVSEKTQITVDDKQEAKEPNPCSEVPKKRRSKSESEKPVSEPVPQMKHHSSSDVVTALPSDDEDIKLHLSGDEKDEPPPASSTQSLDVVEKPVAPTQEVVSPLIVPVDEKTTVDVTQKVTVDVERCDQLSKSPEVSVQGGKVIVKNAVSSKAADEVLKNLLEKGFGCALPPPPTDKIKKVVRKSTTTTEKEDKKIVANEEKSDKNIRSTTRQVNKVGTAPENSNKNCGSVTEKADQKRGEKRDRKTGMLKDIVNQNKQSSSKGKRHSENIDEQPFDDSDDDEASVEKINTSLSNALELKLTYKGLGHFVSKREIYIAKPLKVTMGEGQPLCLAPTEFFSLFGKAPSRQTSKPESAEKPSRKSGSSSLERTPKSDSRRSSSNHDKDRRVRATREGGPSRHQDRSHRNRSPSPSQKYVRGGYYFNDRGSTRDAHRGPHNPRRESYSRRHEAPSSHHRRPSESEFGHNESLASRLKPIEKSEAEDGEIVSSDSSDFEIKTNSNKRRKISSPPCMRRVKRTARDSGTSTERRSIKVSDLRRNHSSPTKLKKTMRRSSQPVAKVNMVLTESPEKERASKRSKIEKPIKKRSTSNEKRLAENSQEEEFEDVDLDDDISFPVLGDDETDENTATQETQPNSANENVPSGMVTRRRAPPRSVNAHKMSALETSTPIQKGKRKLSASPDIPSEDSCHSIIFTNNTEGMQGRSSKKAASSSATPSAKISKPDNKEEKVAEDEIIKNLDVESFLSKLHG